MLMLFIIFYCLFIIEKYCARKRKERKRKGNFFFE